MTDKGRRFYQPQRTEAPDELRLWTMVFCRGPRGGVDANPPKAQRAGEAKEARALGVAVQILPYHEFSGNWWEDLLGDEAGLLRSWAIRPPRTSRGQWPRVDQADRSQGTAGRLRPKATIRRPKEVDGSSTTSMAVLHGLRPSFGDDRLEHRLVGRWAGQDVPIWPEARRKSRRYSCTAIWLRSVPRTRHEVKTIHNLHGISRVLHSVLLSSSQLNSL